MMTKLRTKKRTTKNHKVTKKAHKKPTVDTRKEEREKLVVSATVFPDRLSPDNVGHKVWVTNISLGGIGFRTRREYLPGQTCFVRLDAGPIRFENPLKVMWSKKKDEFTFEVGAQFIPD